MQRKWRPTRKYWNAYKGLYGEQGELGVSQGIGEPEKERHEASICVNKVCKTEEEEQFTVHWWLMQRNIIHHHSPNGGYRNAQEGLKFKRLGVSPGFPDFIFPYARQGYHGLFIELKRVKGGKLSEYQKWWRDFLMKGGYAWFEAKGAKDCIKIVCDYLNLTEEGKARE